MESDYTAAPNLNTGARKVSVTFYQNEMETRPHKAGAITPEKLAGVLGKRRIRAGKSGPAFAQYQLKEGGKRCNADVLWRSGGEGDIDNGAALDDVRLGIDPYTWDAYSTHSHDPENGKFKFRLVLPFSRDVSPDEWPQVWQGFNVLLGGALDPATKDISRLVYLPSCPAETAEQAFYEHHGGELIDPDVLIALAQKERPARDRVAVNDALTSGMEYPPMPETPENIERVKSMLAAIPADSDRLTWLHIIWAVAATGWNCAEELARNWSMTAPGPGGYIEDEFDKAWNSFKPDGGISFGTLVHAAKLNGWVESVSSDPVAMALNEFNARYFVSRIGGGVFVFDEQDESILANGMTFTAFKQFNAGQVTNGVNIPAKWVGWSERRTYQALAFDPSGRVSADVFNTWRGLAVTAAAGSCGLILEHIRLVWCGGKNEQYGYVIKWLALLVQKPWEKPEVALVLRSREGTGKTIIVQILMRIFGVHAFTAAQKDQVAGRFNGHLFDKVLVVLEEAFFAGDPAAVATTKALVTNQTLGYEAKGKDAFSAPNYAHVVSLTNHGWAVPAGEDSRRWMVLDVDESKRGSHDYFKLLAAEIETGGTAAFLQYLMSIDLAGWNPRALPESAALRTQQQETLMRTDPVAGWWLHCLSEGAFTVEDGAVDWGAEILAGDMQESYVRATARARNAPSWDAAAKKLRKLVPAGALGKVRKNTHGGRQFFYVLPDIDVARAYFTAETGVNPCEA